MSAASTDEATLRQMEQLQREASRAWWRGSAGKRERETTRTEENWGLFQRTLTRAASNRTKTAHRMYKRNAQTCTIAAHRFVQMQQRVWRCRERERGRKTKHLSPLPLPLSSAAHSRALPSLPPGRGSAAAGREKSDGGAAREVHRRSLYRKNPGPASAIPFPRRSLCRRACEPCNTGLH